MPSLRSEQNQPIHTGPHPTVSPNTYEDIKSPEPTQTCTTTITNSTHPSTSTLIHDWITHIPSPEQTLIQRVPETPSPPSRKRRRYSESVPSEFLGDKFWIHKKLKLMREMDYKMGSHEEGFPPLIASVTDSGLTSGVRNPSSISPSKLAEAAKPRNSAFDVGEAMDDHGMVFESTAFDKHPDFVNKIKRIVEPDRSSHMQPESAQKFKQYLQTFGRLNESTFLHLLFPLLMKHGYQLVKDRADFTDEEKKILQEKGSVYRDFVMDEGIMVTIDMEFIRTLVPSIHTDTAFEAQMAKALRKMVGVAQANPKPDYAFGLKRNKFPKLMDVPMPPNISALLGIAPGMYDPHLIVEGKADTGSPAEAENQARRGGATLVRANREIRALIGTLPDYEGPDYESFVFSITMSPKLLEFWVHWYQGPQHLQIYHMNQISSHQLRSYNDLDAIRTQLHNIQEWSAEERFHQRQPLFQQIRNYARAEHNKLIAVIEGNSPNKRKRGVAAAPAHANGGGDTSTTGS